MASKAYYSINLVNMQRAAGPVLRRRLKQRLARLRDKTKDFSYHIVKPALAGEAAQARYYGTWHMPAVHVLTSIERFQVPTKIAERLRLAQTTVMQTLAELQALNLVTRGWQVGAICTYQSILHLTP